MKKILRTVSTLVIAVGIAFLFFYLHSQGRDKTDILNQPSYYVLQNYWFVFVSGIVVLVFSLLSSFFSWFKQLDAAEGIRPNAGYASGQDIDNWMGESTANQGIIIKLKAGSTKKLTKGLPKKRGRTEVLPQKQGGTEVLPQKQGGTEVLPQKQGGTEVLPKESRKTELLYDDSAKKSSGAASGATEMLYSGNTDEKREGDNEA